MLLGELVLHVIHQAYSDREGYPIRICTAQLLKRTTWFRIRTLPSSPSLYQSVHLQTHCDKRTPMPHSDEILMQRCLTLAQQALGATRSNPMVGALLLHNGEIVAEGFHEKYGQAHAEVNAIAALKDKSLLKDCILYVNLEPCSHFGKTPPCADLIINSGIKKIVVGSVDPNPKVSGSGINKLIHSGCQVKVGIVEKECRELNKRFYTFHEKQRPWIILKWAQSSDGFISKDRTAPTKISGPESQELVHRWRSEEMAILIGTQTAQSDNPKLTTRLCQGSNPVRVVLDRRLSLNSDLNIFNGESGTIVFSEKADSSYPSNVEVITSNFDNNLLSKICEELHKRKIISLIVEGGAETINHWIRANLWDEARVIKAPLILAAGVTAPEITGVPYQAISCGQDQIEYYLKSNCD